MKDFKMILKSILQINIIIKSNYNAKKRTNARKNYKKGKHKQKTKESGIVNRFQEIILIRKNKQLR